MVIEGKYQTTFNFDRSSISGGSIPNTTDVFSFNTSILLDGLCNLKHYTFMFCIHNIPTQRHIGSMTMPLQVLTRFKIPKFGELHIQSPAKNKKIKSQLFFQLHVFS